MRAIREPGNIASQVDAKAFAAIHRHRVSVICLLIALLPGCAFTRAVTFKSDEQTSFKREGAEVTLDLYARHNPQKECVLGPIKRDLAVSPIIVPSLAGTFIAIAANMAESQIQSYLAKKVGEFTAMYSAQTSIPYYYAYGEPRDFMIKRLNDAGPRGKIEPLTNIVPYSRPAINCIMIQRTIRDNGSSELAFAWVGYLVENDSGSALQLKTAQVTLARAAARTDADTRKVDVSVGIKLDVTTLSDKGESVTTTIADKILRYPGMTTPGDRTIKAVTRRPGLVSSWFAAVPKPQREIDACNKLRAIFEHRCEGVSAMTVSVQVTEVGSGGEAFGQLSKDIDDNRKSFNDALNKAVTDALKASGGSSK